MSKLTNIDPHKPVRLVPVQIPKPWGQEIWYTGMEERGESRVMIGPSAIPLSAYLAHDPAALTDHMPVLLLKILDPKPGKIWGDLYFEVHAQKQEVYVVTQVDPVAWPEGVGGIRFGMNQAKRKAYVDENAFRSAYLQAVTHYEHIRRQIDEQGAAVEVKVERAARQAMDSFTAMRDLRVGDVVRVPTWTPHALQHGVRVVEFQTPTYERFIISFAQKVLTQQHWDSRHAIANMLINTPEAEIFDVVSNGIERIAKFDDFNVLRVDLGVAGPLQLPQNIPYAVCMCLSGTALVGTQVLDAEQACFVPYAALSKVSIRDTGRLLIAAPNL